MVCNHVGGGYIPTLSWSRKEKSLYSKDPSRYLGGTFAHSVGKLHVAMSCEVVSSTIPNDSVLTVVRIAAEACLLALLQVRFPSQQKCARAGKIIFRNYLNACKALHDRMNSRQELSESCDFKSCKNDLIL